MASERERYHALDGLRATMMLLGIVFHCMLVYMREFPVNPDLPVRLPFRDESAASGDYVLLFCLIHAFRMPVFFVMAGFFAALLRERRGAAGLLANRFHRIAVPLAVSWVIIIPLIKGTGLYNAAGGGRAGLHALARALTTGGLYPGPILLHLWFLYYLVLLYPLALGASTLLRRIGPGTAGRARDLFLRAMRSPARPLWFAIPTALLLWAMKSPAGGIDTTFSFWPSPAILATYGVFFGFGWLLYADRDALLPTFPRHDWGQVGLATALLVVNVFASTPRRGVPTLPRDALHAGASAIGALTTWLFVFGLIGLALRHLDRPSATLRYLTDASYWSYLVHVPFLFWLAALIAPLPAPSPVKYLLLIVLTTGSCLATYQLGVRSTFIGAVLNGRRYPRRLPTPGVAVGVRA
jgi:glucans biosynthesis protein C